MTEMEKLRREEKAWEYIQSVRKRRKERIADALLAVEIVLVVYSILMSVAIWKGWCG